MTSFSISSDLSTIARSADGRLVIERFLLGSPRMTVDERDVASVYGDWQYLDLTQGLNGRPVGPVLADDVSALSEMLAAVYAEDAASSERLLAAECKRLDVRGAALVGIEQVRGGAYDPGAR